MWSEMNFTLSPAAELQLFGEQGRSERAFRKLLAALDTKYAIGLPSAFFTYTEDGKPDASGDTTIGMGYTHNGLRVVATGSTACGMLDAFGGNIHYALIREANTMIPMHHRSGEHTASFTPFARPYFLKSLTLGKTHPQSFWYQAAKAVDEGSTWLKEADRKLPRTIGRGLMRQSRLLIDDGDDLEGNISSLLAPSIAGERHWNETGTEFGQRLKVQVHAVGGHTFVRVGERGLRLTLKKLEFSMCGEFTGPWFIGRQKNEAGCQLTPASGAWVSMKEAA